MEIVDTVSQIIVSFVSIAVLMMAVGIFAFIVGQVVSHIFED